jgi:Na+/H+ antiporter NhaC
MLSYYKGGNKTKMMDVLQSIGYGIVALAVLVVVGLVVLSRLGEATGGEANETASYLSEQLGSSGLSGWVPAVIAVAIGALFLSYFMGRKR